MTMKSPLAPRSLSSSIYAATPLLSRQSVTPLSQTPFLRQPELLFQASGTTTLIPGGPTRLTPTLPSRNLSLYLTQMRMEIPSNLT